MTSPPATEPTATGTSVSRVGVAPPALLGLIGLAAFAGLLEVLPRLRVINPEYFPPLSTIVAGIGDQFDRPVFWTALGQTLLTWIVGFGIALVAGVVLGLVIGLTPVVRALTASTIEFLRPIPSVALIPAVAVLYGGTMTSTLILVVYASFWQVLIQVLYGVADVDPVASETARSYRLGRWHRVRYLVWPTALPYAMTGLRLAAAVALILTITGEYVLPAPGIGQQIELAYSGGNVPAMYALVVITGLIGVVANVGARSLERLVLSWHPSIRKEVPV